MMISKVEAVSVGLGVSYGSKEIDQEFAVHSFFCKNCDFSLPCKNERELIIYIREKELEKFGKHRCLVSTAIVYTV